MYSEHQSLFLSQPLESQSPISQPRELQIEIRQKCMVAVMYKEIKEINVPWRGKSVCGVVQMCET